MATMTKNSVATSQSNFLSDNKNLIISLIIIILVSVLGWGGYTTYSSDKDLEIGNQVYTFQQTAFKDFSDKKIPVGEFVQELKNLSDGIGTFKGVVPLIIESADLLIERENNKEALPTLERAYTNFSGKNAYIKYFVGTRLAVVYENLDRNADAIKVLEEINNSSVKLLGPKVYIDLGRLYKKSGDLDKAKVSFEYVVENFNEPEFSKIAKLYLTTL
jgi:predicted negative regulator of RcsB-dependent stress response